MNQGFINRIKATIKAIKQKLADSRAGYPDSQLSPDEEDQLLDELGQLIELLQQFEE